MCHAYALEWLARVSLLLWHCPVIFVKNFQRTQLSLRCRHMLPGRISDIDDSLCPKAARFASTTTAHNRGRARRATVRHANSRYTETRQVTYATFC